MSAPGQTTQLKSWFFIASDGALHDTRQVNWHRKPLRLGYARHYQAIETAAQFKATLRAGPYAWPGGYQLYLLAADGEALCFSCANKNAKWCIEAIQLRKNGIPDHSWDCVACDVNYEDTEMLCAHCNKPIPAAYGSD